MESALHCVNHWDTVEGLRRCARCSQTFCGDCLVDIRGNSYCASCKHEQVLDVRSGVESSTLDLASRGARFAALLLDWLIIIIPFSIVVVMFRMQSIFFGGSVFFYSRRPLALLPMVIFFVYEGLMLMGRGQTIGKIAMGIKVVRVDGTDITAGQAWGRAIMREVLSYCLAIFNYLPAYFTRDRLAIHDMVAGTRVVQWR